MDLLNPGSTVRAETLLPAEVPTPLKLLRRADCYQQRGVKYPLRGTFHSYAELLHFALGEGDSQVSTIVPQGLDLRVGGRRYVPDAYLVRRGERVLVELKPRGEFADELRIPLEEFCRFNCMKFEVVSNESVLEREIEALNWLDVVRTLASAVEINSADAEHQIWRQVLEQSTWELGELLDIGDRRNGFGRELALLRLLHRGQLHAHWERQRLSQDTVFERCA